MKTLLWLDDIRNPAQPEYVPYLQIFSPIERPYTVVWVRNYEEFVSYIEKHGLPDAVSFDHDLADEHYDPYLTEYKEKTGYECAKWLVEFCMDRGILLPLFASHSANFSGRENILSLLNNFKKNQETNL